MRWRSIAHSPDPVTAQTPTPSVRRARRVPWAELLKRVSANDLLNCVCGGRRTIVAVVIDAASWVAGGLEVTAQCKQGRSAQTGGDLGSPAGLLRVSEATSGNRTVRLAGGHGPAISVRLRRASLARKLLRSRRMSQPRRIVPETTSMLTRRCNLQHSSDIGRVVGGRHVQVDVAGEPSQGIGRRCARRRRDRDERRGLRERRSRTRRTRREEHARDPAHR
jgi:hypothetical protein